MSNVEWLAGSMGLNDRKSTADPITTKKIGTKKMAQRRDAVLDVVDLWRLTQKKPCRKGPDDHGGAGGVGQPGESKGQEQRAACCDARRSYRSKPSHQRRCQSSAHGERYNQKAESECNDFGDAECGDAFARRQSADNGQNHQSQHVVHHCGAQNDLAFDILESAQVGQHPRGDADARSGECGAGDDGRQVVQPEQAANAVAQGERCDDADDGDRGRNASDFEQLTEIGFQSDFEKKNHNAQFGEQVQRFVFGADQPQAGGAKEDAGEKLAEDRRLTNAFGSGAAQFCGAEHQDEKAQKLRNAEMVHL